MSFRTDFLSQWKPVIGSELSLTNQCKIRLNQLHFIMTVITLITGLVYTISNLLIEAYIEAIYTSLTLPVFLFCFFLVIKGKYLLSKIILASAVSVLVIILSYLDGIESGVLIFMVPVLIGCQIMFDDQEKFYRLTIMIASFLGCLFLILTESENLISSRYTFGELKTDWLLNYTGAFIGVLFQVHFQNKLNNSLLQSAEISKAEITNANRVLHDSNILIEKKNLQIRQQNTELKLVESQLRKLSMIATLTNSAVIITDHMGRIEWVNQAFEKVSEWRLDEIRGKKPKDLLFKPGYSQNEQKILAEKLMQKQYVKTTITNFTKSGRQYKNELEIHPVFDEKGNHINFISLQRDISAELKYIDEIESLNKKYETVVSHVTRDFIWEWNLTGEKFVGGKPDLGLFDTIEKNGVTECIWRIDRVHPEDRPNLLELQKKKLENQATECKMEYRYKSLGGEYHIFLDRCRIIYDHSGNPINMIGAITDITEQKRVAQELLEEKTKQEKLIAQITLQSQEKEKKFLSDELHENINQILAVSKMYLDSYMGTVSEPEYLLMKSAENINRALDEIRNLSQTLAPPLIIHYDFTQAIRDLCDIQQKTTANTRYVVKSILNPRQDLHEEVKLTSYRIIQEHLTNITKHAGATRVNLNLESVGDTLCITIDDNGIGFDTNKISEKSFGFKKIMGRVNLLGGKMSLQSTPGGGCTLKVVLPGDKKTPTLFDPVS